MRTVFILACTLALGGCNLVYSERPLFSTADARGAPALRPGVWAKPEKDCTFDRSGPVKTWPDCAAGMIVRPGRLIDPNKPEKSIDYLLAAGEPPLIQVPFANDKGDSTVYLYLGMGSIRRDPQGRVTGFVSWFAQCGPPPPKPGPDERKPRYVTLHPLPGLTVDEKSGMCEAKARGPVRASIKASEAWSDDAKAAVWIRDGEQ